MYRWCLIFALLNFADSADLITRALCRGHISRYCRPSKAIHYVPPHNYYHATGLTVMEPLPLANTFEDLAQNLAVAEAAVRNYCRNNSNEEVKEVFGIDVYILKYTLRDFKQSDINVKIKHRVIYVTVNQTNSAPFKDLRMLPSIVNTRQASWALEQNYLKVLIPYNVVFRIEAVNMCGDVNDTIIEVPLMRSNFVTGTYESQQITTEKNVKTTT